MLLTSFLFLAVINVSLDVSWRDREWTRKGCNFVFALVTLRTHRPVRLFKVQLRENSWLHVIVAVPIIRLWLAQLKVKGNCFTGDYQMKISFVLCRGFWSLKMKCPGCSHDIVEEGAKFCSQCGFRLSAPPANTQGKYMSSNILYIVNLLSEFEHICWCLIPVYYF